MHIAICDDNIADRKQLERLLSRESDNRLPTTGVLYIDSYGHETTLLRAPMIYDLFFLDRTQVNHTGLDVAGRLRDFGVTAPIIMCSKTIDYEAIPHTLADIITLKKPIQPKTLNELLTQMLTQTILKKPMIEIRDEENTFYLSPNDILWAKAETYTVILHLVDGSTRRMLGSIPSLCCSLIPYREFWITRKKVIINTSHLSSISLKEAVLNSCISIPLSFGESFTLKNYLKEQ